MLQFNAYHLTASGPTLACVPQYQHLSDRERTLDCFDQ